MLPDIFSTLFNTKGVLQWTEDSKEQGTPFLKRFDLCLKKRYTHISVQDIVDEANISSTFMHISKQTSYSKPCAEIFNHVFSEELNSEETHDFLRTTKVLHRG